MLTITHLTPDHLSAYHSLLTTHPQALLYHHPSWWEVLRHSYGYQPVCLMAVEGNSVVGALPLMRVHGKLKGRRLVSLPFSHFVPILTTHPQAESALLDAAIELTHAENYAYLEIRAPLTVPDGKFQPATLNFISRLDLAPSVETLYGNFSRSNRRNISLASRADFQFHESRDFEVFYRLEVETRHRQGAPMYPPQFFNRLAQQFGDKVRLYFLSHHGKPIAGMVMLNLGKTAIYGYGNSTNDEEIKKLKPTNLLIWEVIQRCKAEGFTEFDFGTTPLHHQNLLEFKDRYHPVTEELPYFYYLNTRPTLPTIQRDSKSVQFAEKVLQTLPRYVFRHLSPLLLREVG